ncbi:MAG: DMT family transporter [Burkholderiales bacterium]
MLDEHLRPALWMVLAGFLFASMGVFVKVGAEQFSFAELVFYRSVTGLAFITLIARSRGLSLRTEQLKAHAGRGVSGLVSLGLYFYSITLLPLPTAVTLNYTSPLFLAALTVLLLGDRPRILLIIAVALGFAGVALLLRPAIGGQVWGVALGLTSGFFAAIAYLNVTHLSRTLKEPEWRIVFYFSLFAAAGAGIWVLADEVHAITLANFWILLGIGITATVAQLAMTRAYGRGNTLTIGALSYSTVVFSSVLSLIVWGQTLDVLAWLAIAIIVLAGILGIKAR